MNLLEGKEAAYRKALVCRALCQMGYDTARRIHQRQLALSSAEIEQMARDLLVQLDEAERRCQ